MAFAAALLAVVGVVAAQDHPLPENGSVELLVRGTDGKTVGANAEVEIVSADKIPFTQVTPRASTKTDERGIAKFEWPGGSYQMLVSVKGVGYGKTGQVEVAKGATAHPPLPPIVPYGHIKGTLPEALRLEDVEVSASGEYGKENLKTTPDAKGHFSFEVKAGQYWISVSKKKQRLAGCSVNAAAGQEVVTRDLEVYKESQEASQGQAYQETPVSHDKVIWAQGTVRDSAGKPIAGATVYALATYHGGIRMYEEIASATSDEKGHYEIKGDGGLSMFSATLVATAEKHAPAWAWIKGPHIERKLIPMGAKVEPIKAPDGPTVDLVLPTTAGTMKVTVLSATDNQPVENAGVGLWLEGANLRDLWAAGGGAEHDQVHHVAYPFARTDKNGVATFEYLLPGRYRVMAVSGDEQEVRRLSEHGPWSPGESPFGEAQSVPVRVGETASLRLGIYRHNTTTKVLLKRADGTPLSGEHVPIEYGSVSAGGGWSSSSEVDATGLANIELSEHGLWRTEFHYRDAPIQSVPIRPPYFSAAGILAISPSLETRFTPTWTARRIVPGSIDVQVFDEAGKGLPCVVEITQLIPEPFMWGSTDGAGHVVFESVPTWSGAKLYARAVTSRYPQALCSERGPVPAEDQLPRMALFPVAVSGAANRTDKVVIKPQSVGWVRGKVLLEGTPQGATANVYVGGNFHGATATFDPKTREYVAGPFTGPSAQLVVVTTQAAGQARNEQEVAVTVGKVVHADLKGPETSATKPEALVLFGMGGITSQAQGELLNGKVFLEDGKTPALGAIVLLYEPEEGSPAFAGICDAMGNIRARGLWREQNSDFAATEEKTREPVIVAFLPGSRGGIVTGIPKKGEGVRIVLPAPRRVTGTVTVGGVAPTKRAGHIRILAAYQGKGRIAGTLSVQTTAGIDGKFELAGLTSGRYVVQAALDDIWVSEAVTLEVEEQTLAPVKLAIAAPGAPVVIKLTNTTGKPAIGRIATLERLAGPFGERLQPKEWMSDSAGLITIPTLEAGKHTVRVGGVAIPFDVPALPVEKAVEVSCEVGGEQ